MNNKIFTLLILFSLSHSANAFFNQKENLKSKKKINKIIKKYGEMKCHYYSDSISFCENNVDYCYRYREHKKGGLSCFKKGQ